MPRRSGSPICTKSTLNGHGTVTVGWRQACGCIGAGVEPCVVLDPFVGSGTTPATAIALGRRGVGIDLSEVYLRDHAVLRVEEAIASGVTTAVAKVVEAVPLGGGSVLLGRKK